MLQTIQQRISIRIRLSIGLLAACLLIFRTASAGHWQQPVKVPTSSMRHAAVMLPDGDVLITGGFDGSKATYGTWRFNPDRGTFRVTGRMLHRRCRHVSVVLPDGRVLLAGGEDGTGQALRSTEIYDPVDGECRSAPDMVLSRKQPVCLLLPDGRLLIGGGEPVLEFFDSKRNRFIRFLSLPMKSSVLDMVLLPDQQVWLFCGPERSAYVVDLMKKTIRQVATSRFAYEAPRVTMLNNGEILVSGDHHGERYDPTQKRFEPVLGNLPMDKGHTATRMPDGRVWLIGSSGTAPAAVAIYDQGKGRLEPGPGMIAPHQWHTTTRLANGHLLVFGGGMQSLPEVFASDEGEVHPCGRLQIGCNTHTSTLMPDGRVLIMGGYNGGYLDRSEIYDPASGLARITVPMRVPRHSHAAALLPNGKVLVTGGYGHEQYWAFAEWYDPISGKFHPIGNMIEPREKHTATLLADGRVLIAGGFNRKHVKSLELYDVTAESFRWVGDMAHAREKHTATLLPDGRVLICGGFDGQQFLDSAEYFDPATLSVHTLEGTMQIGRRLHTATLLASGQVLITGGLNAAGCVRDAECFEPTTNQFRRVGMMQHPRDGHTATLLPDGRVLIAGGGPKEMELYSPDLESFSATTALPDSRREHTSLLLPDGRVLFIGGEDGQVYLDKIASYALAGYAQSENPVVTQCPENIYPGYPVEIYGHGFYRQGDPLGPTPRMVMTRFDGGGIGNYGASGCVMEITAGLFPLDPGDLAGHLRVSMPEDLAQGHYWLWVANDGRYSKGRMVVYNQHANVAGLPSPKIKPTGTPTATPMIHEGWHEDFTGLPGHQPIHWQDESDDPDFNAELVIQPTSGSAVMRRTAESTWGKIRSTPIRCDVNTYNRIEVKVSYVAPGARWNIALRDPETGNYWDLTYATTDIGFCSADYQSKTGWDGIKTFTVQINMEGEAGKYIVIDSVRVIGYTQTQR